MKRKIAFWWMCTVGLAFVFIFGWITVAAFIQDPVVGITILASVIFIFISMWALMEWSSYDE